MSRTCPAVKRRTKVTHQNNASLGIRSLIVNLIIESLGVLNEEALSIKQVVLLQYIIHRNGNENGHKEE